MGHVLTFAQQKGGAGKTTLLAHLAVAWVQAGRRVALIDLDAQQSLTRWANLRADPDLSLIESRDYRASSDMKSARRSHDIVLVDCPGAASSLLDNVVRETDLVVAPCQPSAMDVWACATIIDAALRFKTPCRVLLNRVPPRLGEIEDIIEALGPDTRLLETRIGNRIAYSRAIMSGKTAQEVAPRSVADRETASLAKELQALLDVPV